MAGKEAELRHRSRHFVSGIVLSLTICFSQEFEYSTVLSVPDLGFISGVLTGLDVLEEMNFQPLAGKTIAILTNQTAINRTGTHLLDLLSVRRHEFQVKIIFTPEFGFLSSEFENVTISEEGKDPRFGAAVKYLWGREFRPGVNDLQGVDLIVIDLQDPGVRFFSFVTTVTKVMEVAAFVGIPVLVLDRPNPLNGVVIDGPIVREQYQSYTGYHLVPVRHGLTVGEYALMINESGWIRQSERIALTVIPMANWKREMWMDDTGIPWVPVALNIRDISTLLCSAGLALLGGTNVSVGVGTDRPYLQVGAPWISAKEILESLDRRQLEGVVFSPVTFHPDSISELVSRPRYRGEECNGVRLNVTNLKKFSPILTAATLLSVISGHYPHKFQWEDQTYVDQLYGHDYLRIFLAQERDLKKLPATWSHDVIEFSQFREKFLLY